MNFYIKHEITACGFDTADPIFCADLKTAIEQDRAGQHSAYQSAYDGRFYTLDAETAAHYADMEAAEDTAADIECMLCRAALDVYADTVEATRATLKVWTDFVGEVDSMTAVFLHPYPAMRDFSDYLFDTDDTDMYDPFFDLCLEVYPHSFAWSNAELEDLAGVPRITRAVMQLLAEHIEDVRAYSLKDYRARRVADILPIPGFTEKEYLLDIGGHLTKADRGTWYDVYPAGIIEYHI